MAKNYHVNLFFKSPDSENDIAVFITQPSSCKSSLGFYSNMAYQAASVSTIGCPFRLQQASPNLWFLSLQDKDGYPIGSLALDRDFKKAC